MLGIGLVAGADFLRRRSRDLADGIGAEAGIADHAAFGDGETRPVLGVEIGQLLVARIGFGSEGARRDRGDLAATALAQQRGVTKREFLGEARGDLGGGEQLPDHQRLAQIFAHHFLCQPLLAQCLLEGFAAEIAVEPGEGGDLGELAVDQAFAGDDAVLPAVFGDRGALDQIVEGTLEAAAGNEFLHGEIGVFAAGTVIRDLGRGAQFGRVDRGAADFRHRFPASNAAETSGIGDVAAGEGKCDEAEEGEGDADPELGLEELAEESDHAGVRTH